MRLMMAFLTLAVAASPKHAYAQLWQGPCNQGPSFEEIRADLFGTWTADVSGATAACRYRGESAWTLHRLDYASLRGERHLTIEGARPAGCAKSATNGLSIDVSTEREGESCSVRVFASSHYPGGRVIRGEITRIGSSEFTIETAETASKTIYRRKPWRRPPPQQLDRYVEALDWDMSCQATGERYFHYISTAPGNHSSTTPQIYRQGATFRIRPMVQLNGPGGAHQLPTACTTDWTISNPALATLSADRKSLRIAENAPPGSEFTLSYAVGERRVRHSFRVVAANAVVLTGIRSQKRIEGCEGLEPIGELVFTGDGRFSITYQPFETRVDYSGTYKFDEQTGALTLMLRGDAGNLDLTGRASFEQGNLILEGFFLGGGIPLAVQPDAAPGARPSMGTYVWNGTALRSCRYTF